ncbi:MAG: DUF5916 domain-containing protein [Gammaproteobacteria bacterium]
MQTKFIAIGLAFLFLTPSISSEINIDGILDEEEWKSARIFKNFYEVYPYSLKEVKDIETEILILESNKGIYFGFKNFQPSETMRIKNHLRDEERSISDKTGISIDFDGEGVSAYQFFVSSSGSIGDATIKNETERNWDWDADWKSATSIDKNVWYSEIFIPWSIASMRSVKGEKRTIKLAFYRMLMGLGRGVSTIQGSPYQSIFLSAFDEFEVRNFNTSKIDYFPYITLNEDLSSSNVTSKAGAEIFWKIDSSKQLNLTLNPDFGQIESDEVVVNFSSVETFYSDKRPFFSENNTMFDVKGNFFRILNTRRIGGRPDYDCSDYLEEDYCNKNKIGSSEIDYALRYTQKGEVDFGLLSASERDERFSKGREFYALRLNTKKGGLTYGYMGTYVKKPVLDDNALVHSIDYEYRPSSELRYTGNFLHSDLDSGQGYGLRTGFGYDPDKNFSTGGAFYFLDKKLDINDAGYLALNNRAMFMGRTQFKNTNFSDTSIFRSRMYEIGYGYKTNANFLKQAANAAFKIESTFSNTSDMNSEIFYRSSGRDHRITRNSKLAPYINMPEGYGGDIEYNGPRNPLYFYSVKFKREKGGSEHSPQLGWRTSLRGMIKYTPTEFLSFSFFHKHDQEDNWLNWINGNLLSTFDKKQRTSIIGMEWFSGTKHELRIKGQFVAFTGRNPVPYLGDINGNLQNTNLEIPGITISELAFQVRYRYEVLPLAYLYVVYSKGGRISADDEEDSLSDLYQRPWDNPTDENFTVKLRYRF